jgi:hypothetical protein
MGLSLRQKIQPLPSIFLESTCAGSRSIPGVTAPNLDVRQGVYIIVSFMSGTAIGGVKPETCLSKGCNPSWHTDLFARSIRWITRINPMRQCFIHSFMQLLYSLGYSLPLRNTSVPTRRSVLVVPFGCRLANLQVRFPVIPPHVAACLAWDAD